MQPEKIHKIRSQTDPNIIYEVEVYPDGFMTCTCIFWNVKCFRGNRDCKHVKFIREKYYEKIKR